LEPSDIEAINGIHKQSGHHRSLLGYHKEDGTVFGYTYEQLGWDMTKGGVVPS
jgi:glycerol 2-dehydrogenase (NADP+)